MKHMKRAFVLLLALITVFASACTAEGGRESGDVSSAAESDNAQNTAADSSDEQSEDTAPVGFNDGIYYGVHKLGNSMCGDVWYCYYGGSFVTPDENGALPYDSKNPYITNVNQIILEQYCTEDSFISKIYEMYYYADFVPDGKTEKDIPRADFDLFYNGRFACEYAPYRYDEEKKTYSEAKTYDRPFYMLLETAPLDDGVIDGIMAEYGVDRERAVAIYRQTLIDTLSEHGFYADGFFDWYTYDTRTAYEIVWPNQYIDLSLEDLLYEDSVYGECTHLVFSVYAKADDIEALKEFLGGDANKLFKARALPIHNAMQFDVGKAAYIPDDAALPANYKDRAEVALGCLARRSFGYNF